MIRTLIAGALTRGSAKPNALIAVLALVFVTGCTTGSDNVSGQAPVKDTAAKALDVARTGLTIAKMGAGIYSGLAPCDDAHKPPLCRSEAVLKEIDKALNSAVIALDAADGILTAASSTAADREKAIDIATKAVAAIIGILSRYGLAST